MNGYYSDKINPYLHSMLPFTKDLKKVILKPAQLLSSRRFDVIIKYLYLKYRDLGVHVDWVKDIYIDHIRAFSGGKFREGDSSGKDSLEKYFSAFDAITDSVKRLGFNDENSIVSASDEKVIIDGAHRLAACLYYNSNISCFLFEVKSPSYDFQYFKNRGMKSSSLDFAALEFTKLKSGTYILTIFPVAKGKDSQIDSIIEHYGKIYYKKDVYFNKNGALNFVRQLYYGEPWAGDFSKGFPGERHKASQCFRKDMPLKAYFFEANSLEEVKACKKEIRDLFNFGNNSAHATDEREETIRIAEQLLNNNSINFFNNSTYAYNKKLEGLFLKYRKWIEKQAYNKDNFCIDAGAVLNIYGIREARDMDFLHFGYENLDTGDNEINSHQSEQVYYKDSPEEIIFNPANHFYYNGFKFTAINVLMKMKLNRNETKDKRDVALVKRRMARGFVFWNFLPGVYYKALAGAQYFPEQVKFFILRASPHVLLPYLKAVYRMLKKFKVNICFLYDYFGPYVRMRKYRGFYLFYTRGYSLIGRILGNNIYEPELSQRIVLELKKTKSEYFLDVGANIGLISLNILSHLPDLKIFCFEPGPSQYALLEKTINYNNLHEKMRLLRYSLGEKKGDSQFAAHSPVHTSGDGFFDTKRAGQCRLINVKVDTLDNWWESIGRRSVKVVKIDTEGAELWVLRGAERFIRQCRPTIFLEINKDNFRPYPYSGQDVLRYLTEKQYRLKALDGTLISENNLDYYLNQTDTYIAIPNEY